MAGIFDEVMEGITAKEKQTPPATTPAAAPPPVPLPAAGGQTTPPNAEDKGMHQYADAFKEKYGERKKPA
jgi:hypothetical protein